MIREEFVIRKISLIQGDLLKLKELSQFSADEVMKDFYKLNTLERLMEKIVVRATDINMHILAKIENEENPEKNVPPKSYRDTFLQVAKLGVYSEEFAAQISKSAGLRNMLVHEYNGNFDYNLLYDSLGFCLKDYTNYCNFVLEFMDSRKKKAF